MAKTRAQKEQSVKSITEKLGRAKSVVFANYQGLTMKHLSTLRKALQTMGGEFSVTKNTLMDLALKEAKMAEVPQEVRSGATATLFCFEDEVLPIKALVKAIADAQIGKIKAGFVAGQLLDAVSITRLSALPAKLELQAQLVSLLASPIRDLATVLQGNLRNLVYALDQIRQQKGGE